MTEAREMSTDYPLHVHELVEGEAMPAMVERVARAIYEDAPLRSGVPGWDAPPITWAALNEGVKEGMRKKARAAIEAMRGLNEKMLHAAFVAMNDTPSGQWKRMKAEGLTPRQLFDVKMAPRWRAAIDAALEAK